MSDLLLIEGFSLFEDNKLPPTPIPSDDENDRMISIKRDKIQRRATISLSDLIPVASAALKEKQLLRKKEEVQNSPLARALTKVKIGLQTHRIKERFLVNEWIRLALSLPVNETIINSNVTNRNKTRTKEIVSWYDHKYKNTVLSLAEIDRRVQFLRQLKLHIQKEEQLACSI